MSGAGAPDMSDTKVSEPAVVRLTRRPQFLFARGGEVYRTRSLVVQARKRPKKDKSIHIGEGFTATKKIGNAVIRNRAKRRLRAASAKLLPLYGRAGVDYVFIARQHTPTLAWDQLLDDMEKALVSLASKLGESQGTPSPTPPTDKTPG